MHVLALRIYFMIGVKLPLVYYTQGEGSRSYDLKKQG